MGLEQEIGEVRRPRVTALRDDDRHLDSSRVCTARERSCAIGVVCEDVCLGPIGCVVVGSNTSFVSTACVGMLQLLW